MQNIFTKDVNIFINDQIISQEFHLYEAGYEKCRPTKQVEYAPINYWVLHYCSEGEGYFSTPFMEKQHITAGDLFMIPANCRNIYYPNRKNPWTYHWVGFVGELSAQYLAKVGLTTENCILRGTFDKKIESLFKNIHLQARSHNHFGSLCDSFQLLDYLEHLSATQTESQSLRLFNQIKKEINENFSNNLSINQLAEDHNIDRSYLFKLFQRYEKTNPSIYVQNLKLQKACSLLRKSSLTITEISFETGFSSPSYFSKFFFKKKAMTPKQYRHQFLN
ncbi:MAG: AraC family transcriptional regulator [Enterococcus lacertideformus]|uniref:AraC family transcriptional regulator n=1 Tax=Enterococcus lacertideformus TaxID=2771493 RepID=A0A931FB99_9ENTE|nr:AraC family transcriptional regulator [Enterococcus lacertideformus]